MSDNNAEAILIVGGAVGGRAICTKFVHEGLSLIIADYDRTAGAQLATHLGQGASFEFVDIRNPKSVAALMRRVAARFGAISHMISLVGGALDEDWNGLEGTSVATIRETTLLNLVGHEFLLKYAKPLLVASPTRNKSVILIGSINALGSWDLPAYSAAKAGLIGLMHGAANEFTLDCRIRINVLVVGTVLSDRTRRQPKNFSLLRRSSLLGEFPAPAEIAEAVYMLTYKLPHCTQQTLVIDSGQTAYAPVYNLRRPRRPQ